MTSNLDKLRGIAGQPQKTAFELSDEQKQMIGTGAGAAMLAPVGAGVGGVGGAVSGLRAGLQSQDQALLAATKDLTLEGMAKKLQSMPAPAQGTPLKDVIGDSFRHAGAGAVLDALQPAATAMKQRGALGALLGLGAAGTLGGYGMYRATEPETLMDKLRDKLSSEHEKTALNDGDTAALLAAIPGLGPLAAGAGAAVNARDGYGFQQGAGTLLGGGLGTVAGALGGGALGALSGSPGLSALLGLAGAMAGSSMGARAGNEATQPKDIRNALYQKLSSERDLAAGFSGLNPVLGGVYAGATAPEGEGLRRGLGTGVGGTLGSLAGAAGGSLLGAGGAMALNQILDKYDLADDEMQAALLGIGGSLGAAGGALGGGILGGGLGYDLASKPKQASTQGPPMKTASDVMFLEGVKLAMQAAGLDPRYTRNVMQYGIALEKQASNPFMDMAERGMKMIGDDVGAGAADAAAAAAKIRPSKLEGDLVMDGVTRGQAGKRPGSASYGTADYAPTAPSSPGFSSGAGAFEPAPTPPMAIPDSGGRMMKRPGTEDPFNPNISEDFGTPTLSPGSFAEGVPSPSRGGQAGNNVASGAAGAVDGAVPSYAPSLDPEVVEEAVRRGIDPRLLMGGGAVGLGGVGALGYGMGDADTAGNKARRMSNDMLGTNFNTQSRLSALLGG